MSSRRISRIEAGEVDPRYDEMIALADALNITPGTLVVYADSYGRTTRDSTDKSLTDDRHAQN